MMYGIKAAAAVLVLFTACTVSGEYKKFIEKKLALCEGFLSLLTFIKAELACRGRSVREWAKEFSDTALSDVGFTQALIEKESLDGAFRETKDKMPMLGAETVRLLEGYFSTFGKSYRAEEEGEACRVFEELNRLLAREKSDCGRSVRAVRVLSYAVALGIIILLI